MCRRDRPRSLASALVGLASLVATTQRSRSAAIRRPTMRSESPVAYASAVSIAFSPASRVAATMRAASASSVWSPNIIAPSQSFETLRPLAPSDVGEWRWSAMRCAFRRRSCGGDEAVAQFALEHLADRAARELVDDREVRDTLRLAEPLVRPRAQRLGVDRRAFAHDDPRRRRLAPALGGNAGDRRVGDRGMLAEHRLEVARVEVEAAADDHVLAAIDEREKAVVVEAADVAGADEALAGGVEPLGLGGALGLAVVAGHHPCRMADDLAGIALRQLAALLVDQADEIGR